MDSHDKMKNYSNYFEAAIAGVIMLVFFGGLLILSVIKLIETIIK